ncbi:Calcium/calmodulin-dependent protein kinase kinase [Taphrina deformans PYCC 5710]|uniref:Calcium/calmodulin-dependent protein kinase kinase n=1 Tax=Taphrina deformans (strain PYCC 5710 / ATCC 11124 / CBS 356.35 / IMI 108563 / JCM 9778 / NBRC 8474) TaxID=1097556 RepID=R4XA61_TAPDE|nr:Calcium/calmodulin-dependent protein kinase kinase [Taphrina deformans PYCC 5710]|eukprot:CCG81159.1 Calcium/calmodulin-dependent protein kinase kinase [Taphrina deformans PYCC 5710]
MSSAYQEDYPAPSYQQVPLAQLLHRGNHVRQLTSPMPLKSPERHHRRALSAPRSTKVKETLDARVTKREDGVRMLNQYHLKEELGRGSYGTVLLAEDTTTGKEYAVKEFSKARLRKRNHSAILRRPRTGPFGSAGRGGQRPGLVSRKSVNDIHKEETAGNALALVRSEIAIMKKLDHENLIDLLEVLDDPDGDSLYMVLELCKKGVIMNIGFGANASAYSDEECRHFFRDLILGIEYLHAQGIAHRDIKPDNLLLSSDLVLKIVDFGVSEMFEVVEDQKISQSGSPAFMSPELCRGQRETKFLKPSDIWSMGVTLFCLKFGTLPYGETNIIELCAQIINEVPDILNPEFEYNKRHLCDENLLSLFSRLFEKDPDKRITMNELREHPWVTLDGEDELLSYEENTAQMIDEITEDDLRTAIKGIRGIVTVVKAVNKLKQMRASRAASRDPSPVRTTEPQAVSNFRARQPDEEYLRDVAGDTRALRQALSPLQTSFDAANHASKEDESRKENGTEESEAGSRGRSLVPSPTIEKRSCSADEAQWRSNTTEDRILTHARDGMDPGREFDTHPRDYYERHHSDQLNLSPNLSRLNMDQFDEGTAGMAEKHSTWGAVVPSIISGLITLDSDSPVETQHSEIQFPTRRSARGTDCYDYP